MIELISTVIFCAGCLAVLGAACCMLSSRISKELGQ